VIGVEGLGLDAVREAGVDDDGVGDSLNEVLLRWEMKKAIKAGGKVCTHGECKDHQTTHHKLPYPSHELPRRQVRSMIATLD